MNEVRQSWSVGYYYCVTNSVKDLIARGIKPVGVAVKDMARISAEVQSRAYLMDIKRRDAEAIVFVELPSDDLCKLQNMIITGLDNMPDQAEYITVDNKCWNRLVSNTRRQGKVRTRRLFGFGRA